MSAPVPTKTIWVTKDGQRVRVRDMTDSHLVNTLRLLFRNAERMRFVEYCSIASYATTAPDMASDAANDAADELLEMDNEEYLERTIPTFPALVREAERRGLSW